MITIKQITTTITLLLSLVLVFSVIEAKGQTEITFKVNLAPQIEDNSFVPGKDEVYLQGDTYPLSNSKTYLKDSTPADSVYEATVKFPSSANGDRLNYNFVIDTQSQKITEEQPRVIEIDPDNRELDALYFNSFAW